MAPRRSHIASALTTMPAAPRLVCPAVATFLWRQPDRGKHQIFLSFGAEDGAPVVGLRMGPSWSSSWSGWHGYWERTPKSLTVWVSWRGSKNTTEIFLKVWCKDSLSTTLSSTGRSSG